MRLHFTLAHNRNKCCFPRKLVRMHQITSELAHGNKRRFDSTYFLYIPCTRPQRKITLKVMSQLNPSILTEMHDRLNSKGNKFKFLPFAVSVLQFTFLRFLFSIET